MASGIGRFTGMFAFCSAVTMLAGSAAVAHADGLDRGGACCADLEERVAELEATTARKGNRRVSLTISGQVHTALMAWDDGDRSDLYIVDVPNVGGTQFNLNGSAKISPAVTAGFHIQVGLDKGARSHQVTATDDDGGQAGDTTMVITLANWYLDHKSLGRLTVGRANTATAGISGIDLGGVSAAANVNIGYWNRSFSAVGSGVNWSDLLGGGTVNGSTLSRGNVVNYTSPTAGGFSVAAAWGENDVWDVALRYAGEFSGFRVAAGIGYINNGSGTNEVVAFLPHHADAPSQVKGSASILHVASGLFLTGAFVNQDNNKAGRNDTTLWFVQGGIAKNWTGLGNTVFYGEYANVDDGVASVTNSVGSGSANVGGIAATSDANVWGLGVVQHIDAAAMELYLSYRNYSGEVDYNKWCTEEAKDMSVVMGGARIRF
jgi:predicted porin